MLRILITGAIVLAATAAAAGDVKGEWARDDGKAKVRLTSCGGDAVCGAISWLRDPKNDPGKVGQQVFFDMKPHGDNAWTGTAFNPEDGKTYSGKMSSCGRPSDDRRLRVRRPDLQVSGLDPGAVGRRRDLPWAAAFAKKAAILGSAALIALNPAFARIGEENAFAVLAKAAELQRQGRDVINLGIGQPDFKTPPHIVEAAVKALRDGEHGYTDATGILPLREAVSEDLHRRLGVEVSPDLVLITPGGKVAMFMAILMFGEEGADIVYPDPGFPIYRSMIEFAGARPVADQMREANGFAFSAEETLKLMTPRTRLVIVNSPANPTGGVTPKAEIDKLVAGLARFPNAAILSDEIYGQLTYDRAAHRSLLAYPEVRDRLILLDGWSKTYAMTGWRLGYSVWPKPWRDVARKLAVNSYSCVNSAAQFAGIAALKGSQDSIAAMRDEFDRRRKAVVDGLNRLPGVSAVTPKGAFYAFPNVSKTGWKAKPLASALLEEAGVATVGGPDFGLHGEGYLRLSYANSLENIERALERMGEFLSRPASTNATS